MTSLLEESVDCITIKLQKHKQSVIKSAIERNMQTFKVNSEFLMKSYEDFIADAISETEYQLFKKSFNIHTQTAVDNITVLREELIRIDNSKYIIKCIEKFLEHKNMTELNRCIVVKLIRSIVVNSSDDIIVNFRYLNDFELPVKEQNNDCYYSKGSNRYGAKKQKAQTSRGCFISKSHNASHMDIRSYF